MDQQQRVFKVYSWLETNTHITYVYIHDDDTPVSFVVLLWPEFVEIGTGRTKKYQYVFENNSTNNCTYKYHEFHPANVYVNSLRPNNTRILAPWLCYQKDNNKNVFIMSDLSTKNIIDEI